MPEVVVPFTPDMSAVERAFDDLVKRIADELPAEFARAVDEMGKKFDELKSKIQIEPIELKEPERKEEKPIPPLQNPTAGLEGRKEISVDEMLSRFGRQQERTSIGDLIGQDTEIRQEIREQTELLRQILEYLQAQEGD